MRCHTHPDRTTPLTCAICERAYCEECLKPSPLGEACPSCSPAAWAQGGEARASIPRKGPAPGRAGGALTLLGNIIYWGLVALPLVGAGVYASDLASFKETVVDSVAEPRRLGESVAALTDFAAKVEGGGGQRLDPASIALPLKETVDPFRRDGGPLGLSSTDGEFILCSLGPDRNFDGGQPMDRFTGKGDICLNLGAL